MGFLRIGWQNYFNIMIFLLKYTYILICMWRNVRYNFFDFCLGSTAMCRQARASCEQSAYSVQENSIKFDQSENGSCNCFDLIGWFQIKNDYEHSVNRWRCLSPYYINIASINVWRNEKRQQFYETYFFCFV